MGRKSVFDIISQKHDISVELKRINTLLNDKNAIEFVWNSDPFHRVQNRCVFSFVDSYAFKRWEGRGTCLDIRDFMRSVGIDQLNESETIHEKDALLYLEACINIVLLVEPGIKSRSDWKCTTSDVFDAALNNILLVIDLLNYEVTDSDENAGVILTKNDVAAASVAEFVDSDLGYEILKYNHFALKGEIEEKKKILNSIGNALEPMREELNKENTRLTTDIFFVLNNYNIRHNNCDPDGKHLNPHIENISANDIEEVYDDLYQMCLLAFLLIEQTDRYDRIAVLRKNSRKKTEV